jgi:hypothetical protein
MDPVLVVTPNTFIVYFTGENGSASKKKLLPVRNQLTREERVRSLIDTDLRTSLG